MHRVQIGARLVSLVSHHHPSGKCSALQLRIVLSIQSSPQNLKFPHTNN